MPSAFQSDAFEIDAFQSSSSDITITPLIAAALGITLSTPTLKTILKPVAATAATTLSTPTLKTILKPVAATAATTLSTPTLKTILKPVAATAATTLSTPTLKTILKPVAATAATTLSTPTLKTILKPVAATAATTLSTPTLKTILKPVAATAATTLSTPTLKTILKPVAATAATTLSTPTLKTILKPVAATAATTLSTPTLKASLNPSSASVTIALFEPVVNTGGGAVEKDYEASGGIVSGGSGTTEYSAGSVIVGSGLPLDRINQRPIKTYSTSGLLTGFALPSIEVSVTLGVEKVDKSSEIAMKSVSINTEVNKIESINRLRKEDGSEIEEAEILLPENEEASILLEDNPPPQHQAVVGDIYGIKRQSWNSLANYILEEDRFSNREIVRYTNELMRLSSFKENTSLMSTKELITLSIRIIDDEWSRDVTSPISNSIGVLMSNLIGVEKIADAKTDYVLSSGMSVFLSAIVENMYIYVQKSLHALGVSEMTLYRAIEIDSENFDNYSMTVTLNTLSSFTDSESVAKRLAELMDNGIVLISTVPAQRVFSTSLLGIGRVDVSEVIMIGSTVKVEARDMQWAI